MATIGIIGATGYAGGSVAREAVARGHQVLGLSRHEPAEPIPGVDYLAGSIESDGDLVSLARDSDVVFVAVHGAVEGQPYLIRHLPSVLAAAEAGQARLGVGGGAGSLFVRPGGPRLFDTPEFPEMWRVEATSHYLVLEALGASSTPVDWFYLSPAALFGSFNPGTRRGAYRVGGDVLLTDEHGESHLGGEDYGAAVLDEIEAPAHHRARFHVAY